MNGIAVAWLFINGGNDMAGALDDLWAINVAKARARLKQKKRALLEPWDRRIHGRRNTQLLNARACA